MKSYTDLEQSKKLAEILPVESADMHYWKRTWRENDYAISVGHSKEWQEGFESKGVKYIPCWSLSALLDLCPTINGKQPILTRGKLTSLWYCYYEDEIDTQTYDNPIDACYEMITRLNELNLL